MSRVTGLTADRMLEIEAASIVDGEIVGDDLILERHDGVTINAGNVRGPQGDQGIESGVPEAWTSPAPENAWLNFGAPEAPLGYYKHDGRVYLRGTIKNGVASSVALTLPVGYRPPYAARIPIVNNGAFSYVLIGTDGTVKPVGTSGAVTLDAVHFRVA